MNIIKKIIFIPRTIYRRVKARYLLPNMDKSAFVAYPYTLDSRGGTILIDKEAFVNSYAWWIVSPLTGKENALLSIGKRSRIGLNSHIVATHRITIGDNVEIAPRVYISDNAHGYEDINTPPRDQPIIQKKDVNIGDDSWLGENVCVLGVCIGKHCVIGSNAVVTSDIPDYCVAVGAPAKIVKRYNFETQKWEKTNPDGSFIKQTI